MYSIEELWNQAVKDSESAPLHRKDTQAYLCNGIKIERNSDNSHMLRIAYEGDFYRALPSIFCHILYSEGWKKGVLVLALDRCDNKIFKLEDRLKNAEPQNKKYIDNAISAHNNATIKSQLLKNKINYYER